MYEYPYPYNQVNWTANDQKYWFAMCRRFKYPVSKVRDPYRYLIETNKDATWEAEYQQYLTEQNAAPAAAEGSA
ncbi:hypothetical protein [Paenibacillus gansuensis]|uniref:Uncharacterized protein n=1 Tax=Paenibacillus gansuensis TaxID=306542 RepID=A0ABW5PI99_9BACL